MFFRCHASPSPSLSFSPLPPPIASKTHLNRNEGQKEPRRSLQARVELVRGHGEDDKRRMLTKRLFLERMGNMLQRGVGKSLSTFLVPATRLLQPSGCTNGDTSPTFGTAQGRRGAARVRSTRSPMRAALSTSACWPTPETLRRRPSFASNREASGCQPCGGVS